MKKLFIITKTDEATKMTAFQKIRLKISKKMIIIFLISFISLSIFVKSQTSSKPPPDDIYVSPSVNLSDFLTSPTPTPDKNPAYVHPIPTSPTPGYTYSKEEADRKWSEYRATRIKDLKAALKIIEDQIASYKNEADKLLKDYDQLISLYQSGSITQSEFESTSKKFIDADNFIRTTLRELAKEADTDINLIRRFENGENVTPAEEKAIRGL